MRPGAAQHELRNHRPLGADLRVPGAADVRIIVEADRRGELEVLQHRRVEFGEHRVDVARAERRRVAETHDVARVGAGRARVVQLFLVVLVADGDRHLPAVELVDVARRLGVEDRVLGLDAVVEVGRDPVVDRRVVEVRVGADPVIAVRAGAREALLQLVVLVEVHLGDGRCRCGCTGPPCPSPSRSSRPSGPAGSAACPSRSCASRPPSPPE